MSQSKQDCFGRNFWCTLLNQQYLDEKQFVANSIPFFSKEEILGRIEDFVVQLVHQISCGETPQLKYRSRKSWNNCIYIPNIGLQLRDDCAYTTISLGHESSVERFGLMLKVLTKIYKLLQTDKTATKRDMFYEDVLLFRNQIVLDQIVDDIACLLDVPRRMLNVVATSKGCLYGDLEFTESDGTFVDCKQAATGVMVPLLIDKISNIRSKTARFILVIEKDATFQRLLDDDFVSSMKCIIITGKGVPDVNTRLMIRKMWENLHIPVFGLMDADPHGIEILFVYKFGSMSQSFDSVSLALPFIHWIGVFPSDVTRLSLPCDVAMPLNQKDEAKCRDLLCRPYIEHFPLLKKEIIEMTTNKVKAEIEALTKISSRYLSEIFLPSKIKHGEWI